MPSRPPKRRWRVAEARFPEIYSIAAHRGFADALVAGLVPRYREPDVGLARLTLLLPSQRAVRTVTEAFIRHSGAGLLMPRMAVVGDLDLDETLGALLDPIGAGAHIAAPADPARRWLRLAELIRQEQGDEAPRGAALLRLARDMARSMDRLLVEDIGPEELVGERVRDVLGDLSHHWLEGLRLFARVQQRWLAELEERGEIDPAARRNRLFDHAAARWRESPPSHPVVAAGVTSAAPALARLLRVIADMPKGAVILPDLDLALNDAAWDELGHAGMPPAPDAAPVARHDAVSHPQYHLKLLLNRMGIARGEVRPWHRAGQTAAPPARSRAITSVFLPPEASKSWVDLGAEDRRLSAVRLMESANPEAEAQAIALLLREALETPERRAALVTPDRGLAGRVVANLRRWNIAADDSAGRPLSQTAAGRVMLLLAEVMAEQAAPVPLMALLIHPLVHQGEDRAAWLDRCRALELKLRGPRPGPGMEAIALAVDKLAKMDAGAQDWWATLRATLDPLMFADDTERPMAELIDGLTLAAETLCGDAVWAREDGRALAGLIEELRGAARDVGTVASPADMPRILRDAMDLVAVRPPFGGHPRIAIYGLLESRMSRADLVICAGLNEGTWPQRPSPDPLLAPGVLRALGVPGGDFRIGLSAHDLAGALGAPQVVLSRSLRDGDGKAVPSRFWLRVKALLGSLIETHEEKAMPALAQALDVGSPAPPYPRPEPVPSAEQRNVAVAVTALDRLRSDPYQFYARAILQLRSLDALDAEPSAAWRGVVAHDILEHWHKDDGHKKGVPIRDVALARLEDMKAHPLMSALWAPRLLAALDWVERRIAQQPERDLALAEKHGEMKYMGVTIHGRADRIDRLPGGELAIVDYKSGHVPSGREVENGYALQLGTLGLMARAGAFAGVSGEPVRFEYWSLGRDRKSGEFGVMSEPVREGQKRSGIPRDEFLDKTEEFLSDALTDWIKGNKPFTARLNPDATGYADYDQLMRLDEWQGREASENAEGKGR